MNIKHILIAALATAAAVPASAFNLIAGTGWQSDEAPSLHAPSTAGPITFTVAHGNALFSLTDTAIPGNLFTVSVAGSITLTTDFSLQPTPFDNSLGQGFNFAAPWLDSQFSRLQLNLGGPGSYSITVTGDCSNTCPSTFGFRLDQLPDAVGGVPEPASWALLIAGFGLVGAAQRRRRVAVVAA